MNTSWKKVVKGYVKVEIIGQESGLFLDECLNRQVRIWDIKPSGPDTFTGYLMLEDIPKVKGILKNCRAKIRFKEKKGTPFFMKKVWNRNGFLIGMAAFIVILFLLSNMIWNINVSGANPKTEYKLRQAASQLGITKGKFIFLLPNVREIQQKLTDKMDNVTWIGVTLKGTTYRFEVVEKELPKEIQVSGPSHLVSTKEAIITDMFVEKGQPVVSINDYVHKGSLLVSGYIGKKGKAQLVSSKGKVFGEVWYQSTVEVPLKTEFKTYTGNIVTKQYIRMFGRKIPVWGWNKKTFKHQTFTENSTPFQLLNWTLPFSYEKDDYRETDGVKRQYSETQAIQVGKTMALKELKKKIPIDAQVKGEKVWQQSVSDGKVKLTMLYQVIENIASEQPIPIQQGE